MSGFQHVESEQRFEQPFDDSDGASRLVFADYARRGDLLVILHVEADPALRGSGAAGKFMQSLSDHARAEGLRMYPSCGYARTWWQRHPDYKDVVEF